MAMAQDTPILFCCGLMMVWKQLSGGYDWAASCPRCGRDFGYQGPFGSEICLPVKEMTTLATDEEGASCGAVCPTHGEPCPITLATRESSEAIEFVSMMTGEAPGKSHCHLCLANPDEPHSWSC